MVSDFQPRMHNLFCLEPLKSLDSLESPIAFLALKVREHFKAVKYQSVVVRRDHQRSVRFELVSKLFPKLCQDGQNLQCDLLADPSFDISQNLLFQLCIRHVLECKPRFPPFEHPLSEMQNF